MDLATFQSFANHIGLVPMRFVQDVCPYPVGTVAGFPPDQALLFFADREAYPTDKDGEPLATFGADDDAEAVVVSGKPLVEIPGDWVHLHHLRRYHLAMAISGSQPSNTGEADEIIRAEIARRQGTET